MGLSRHLLFTCCLLTDLCPRTMLIQGKERAAYKFPIQWGSMFSDNKLCICPEIKRTSAGGEAVNARARTPRSNQRNNNNKKIPNSHVTRCTEANLGRQSSRRHVQLVITLHKLKLYPEKKKKQQKNLPVDSLLLSVT